MKRRASRAAHVKSAGGFYTSSTSLVKLDTERPSGALKERSYQNYKVETRMSISNSVSSRVGKLAIKKK